MARRTKGPSAAEPARRGELGEGVLPGVLRTLYSERKTGLLHVTRGGERGSVCFVKGAIVYGDTTIPECHMGETLVRHGLLTQDDLDRALDLVRVTGRRLGEVLLDLGIYDADGVEDALALQVREVLLTVFSWREGRYVFEEHDPSAFRGYDHPLPLSTGEVILDAVWSITDPDVIRFSLGDLDRVLVPASDPLLRFQRLSLTPTDGFILSRVDGVLTAAEILRMAPVSVEEAQRSLCGLLHTGMVEYLRPSAPAARRSESLRDRILDAHARLASQRPHEVLGVDKDASPGEIQAAFVRLAKLYHPDAHHGSELADLKDKLEALFARVTEAHRTLGRSRGVAAPPPTTDGGRVEVGPPSANDARPAVPPPVAAEGPEATLRSVEEDLNAASEALAAGRYWDVLAAVNDALPRATGRERRRARTLRAQALLKGDGGRRAAEEELKAALAEDAANADAHFILGTIYREGGAHALAAASFRRVLQLKPRHTQALNELASLEPKDETPSGFLGLFKRS
jgi:hypothetical protein